MRIFVYLLLCIYFVYQTINEKKTRETKENHQGYMDPRTLMFIWYSYYFMKNSSKSAVKSISETVRSINGSTYSELGIATYFKNVIILENKSELKSDEISLGDIKEPLELTNPTNPAQTRERLKKKQNIRMTNSASDRIVEIRMLLH